MIICVILSSAFLPLVKADPGLDFAITFFDVQNNVTRRYYVEETVIIYAQVKNTGTETIEAYRLEGVFTVISPSSSQIDAGTHWNIYHLDPEEMIVLEGRWAVPYGAEQGWYDIKVVITSKDTDLAHAEQKNNAFEIPTPNVHLRSRAYDGPTNVGGIEVIGVGAFDLPADIFLEDGVYSVVGFGEIFNGKKYAFDKWEGPVSNPSQLIPTFSVSGETTLTLLLFKWGLITDVSPASRTIKQGDGATYEVTATATGDWTTDTGQTVSVQVEILNTPPGAAKNFAGSFMLSQSVPSDTHHCAIYTSETDTPTGTYHIEFEGNIVSTTTTHSETVDLIVEPKQEVLPDLVIQDFWWSPEHPEVGETVTFTYTEKNKGPGDASAHRNTLLIDDYPISNDVVDPLAAGASRTRTFPDAWIRTAGGHEFLVVADDQDAVTESEEENNALPKQFDVDYVSTSLTVELSLSSIPPNTRRRITISGRLTRTDTHAGIAERPIRLDWTGGLTTVTTSDTGYYSYSTDVGPYTEGTYEFTARFDGYETSSTVFHPSTARATLVVQEEAFDFSVSVSPSSQDVVRGFTVDYTVTVTLLSGSGTVSLSLSGLLSSVGVSDFDPDSGSPSFSSTLTVGIFQGASTGSYPLTVTGAGGGVSKPDTCTLVVKKPSFDFLLSADPSSRMVHPGESAFYTINVNLENGDPETVTLSLYEPPSWVTYSYSLSSGSPTFTSTLTVTASISAPVGHHTLHVKGSCAGMTDRMIAVTLVVEAPDPSPQSPPTPSLISPINGATLSSMTATFSWSSSPGGTDYQIEVTGPSSRTETVTSTSYSATLSPGSYTWRIRAHNSDGYSGWTSEWSFTIIDHRFVADHGSFHTELGFGNVMVCKIDYQNLLDEDAVFVFLMKDSNGKTIALAEALAPKASIGTTEVRKQSFNFVGQTRLTVSWEAYRSSDVNRQAPLDRSTDDEQKVYVSVQGSGPITNSLLNFEGDPERILFSEYGVIAFQYNVYSSLSNRVVVGYSDEWYKVSLSTDFPFILPTNPVHHLYVFIPDEITVDSFTFSASKGSISLEKTCASEYQSYSGKWYVFRVDAGESIVILYTWSASVIFDIHNPSSNPIPILISSSTLEEILTDLALRTVAAKFYEYIVRKVIGGEMFGLEDVAQLVFSFTIDYISSNQVVILNPTQKAPAIQIRADSPVNILVTAPNGLEVGYDSRSQGVINEIPGASYTGPGTEPQIITIPNPLQGDYAISVIGTGTGNYELTVESSANGTLVDTVTYNGTTFEGKIEERQVVLQESNNLTPVENVTPLYLWAILVAATVAVLGVSSLVYSKRHAKILQVNKEKKLVRRLPRLAEVKDWVEQAKKLPRKVEY